MLCALAAFLRPGDGVTVSFFKGGRHHIMLDDNTRNAAVTLNYTDMWDSEEASIYISKKASKNTVTLDSMEFFKRNSGRVANNGKNCKVIENSVRRSWEKPREKQYWGT